MESLKDIIRRSLFETARPKPAVRDLEGTKLDAGGAGKAFETTLIRSFDLVGLAYDKNRVAGSLWDVRPKGEGWDRLINNKDINIKVAGARWMFGSSEFSKILPWDEIDDIKAFNKDEAATKIAKIIRKRHIHRVSFLNPKSKEIEQQIEAAVNKQDVDKLDELLVKKNFKIRSLGGSFAVRVSVKDGHVGSIAIEDSNGKVFARSERPRVVKGSMLVGFRAPRDALLRSRETKLKTPE